MAQEGAELRVVVGCRVSWIVMHELLRVGCINLVLMVHVHCCSSFDVCLIGVPA